jgi:hypothetical protein
VDDDVDLSCKVLDRDRTVEQAFINATLGDRALDRASLFPVRAASMAPMRAVRSAPVPS